MEAFHFIQVKLPSFLLCQSLNASPALSSSLFNIGMAVLPMPCNFNRSFSEYWESCLSVLMSALSNARLAGAASNERKPSFGFFAASQTGQVGQSLLL